MIYHGDAMEYIGETPDILSRIIEDQASVCRTAGKYSTGTESVRSF